MRLASLAILFAVTLPAVASHRPHHGSKHHAQVKAAKAAVPRVMDSERATQIQTALIAHGYLTGTPTGTWDEQSQAAMVKLQADNHWQTKLVPDSRAIIKLGLGPDTTTGQPTSEVNSTSNSDSTFASVSQH